MQKNMGADVKTLGLISIVYYGAGIIASRLFGSRLSKRFSDRAVLCAAFLLLGTYCALLPLCRMPWMVMLVQMLGGFSRNLMCSSMIPPWAMACLSNGCWHRKPHNKTAPCPMRTRGGQTVDKPKSTVFFYKENRISMSNI